LTLTLRGKAMDGFEETARTEPSTALSTELGKPANGCRFPTSVNRPAALRRGAFARPLLFTTNGTYNRQKSDAGNTINPSTKSGQAQSSKECYEDCVCQVIEAHSKKPPWWGPTNMCWDQRNKVDIFCTERCKGK
jgi:hypothetical protein